jgi:hypothetical protein
MIFFFQKKSRDMFNLKIIRSSTSKPWKLKLIPNELLEELAVKMNINYQTNKLTWEKQCLS